MCCYRTLTVKVQSHLIGINMLQRSMRYWWRRRLQMNSYMRGTTHTLTLTYMLICISKYGNTINPLNRLSIRCMQQQLTRSTMCVVLPGHLMMTMNLTSFKSLEILGIKWKTWSYQTCQHKTPFLEFLGFSLWKKNRNKVIEGPFGLMHQKNTWM